MEKRKKRRIGCLVVAAVFILTPVVLLTAGEKAWWYTEAQHIARIKRKVNKTFMTNEFEFESFDVYPLYSQDEKLGYFLVEFAPKGFMYVELLDEYLFIMRKSCCGRRSLYAYDGYPNFSDKRWSRYDIVLGDIRYFESGLDNKRVVYENSPFAAADIKDEKRYMLDLKDVSGKNVLVPAVKRGDKYINLISLAEVKFEYGCLTEEQAATEFRFCHGCYLV